MAGWMKAVVLEGAQKLTVKQVPMPEVTGGSVLIRVRACSVCATDLRAYRYGREGLNLPLILGHEVGGEVIQVAPGVTTHRIGERVAVTPRVACGVCYYCRRGQPSYCENHVSFGGALAGGFAEYMLIPKRAVEYGALNPFPENVSFAEASLAEPLSCCIRAQNHSPRESGRHRRRYRRRADGHFTYPSCPC